MARNTAIELLDGLIYEAWEVYIDRRAKGRTRDADLAAARAMALETARDILCTAR
jgi:1,2-phenylacetyl-CoA epoxidase PaaB subunit